MDKFAKRNAVKVLLYRYILLGLIGFICSCKKAPANDGVIKGAVLHAGKAVSDAPVTLSSNTLNLSTTSGAFGEYRFEGLPRGFYQIQTTFRKETITGTGDTIVLAGQGSFGVNIARDAQLIEQNIETSQDTSGNARISGIISHSGTPIPLASVSLLKGGQNYLVVQADSNGNYKFESVRKGDYQLSADFQITISSTATDYTYITGTGSVNVQIKAFSENQVKNIETNIDTLSAPLPVGGGGVSCPYVYAFNGESYIFNGDIYAGAIYASIERNDYIPLVGMKDVGGEYKIKIANELQERQYTNLAELMVISHPNDVQVLMDKNGNIHTLSDKHSALSALSPNGIDYVSRINKTDNVSYLFDEISNKELTWLENISNVFVPQTGKTSLVLTFDRSKNVEKGKLVVRAKNSDWSAALWNEFTGFFGTHYDQWQKEQNLRPAEELLKWRLDEGIPIMVSVETENGWEYIDCFNIVGSVVPRDMVMPIDLSKIHGDKMRIKLECAFKFWELDYAAMDFTGNVPLTVEKIIPNSISSKNGRRKCDELKADDNLYLAHLKCGDENVLTYPASKLSTTIGCSFFLHSKGYYEEIKDNKEDRQVMKLLGFMRPGSFAQYSLERYQELLATGDLAKH